MWMKEYMLTSLVALGMRSEWNSLENEGFLRHDNAPAHQSVLINDSSAKNNVITLEYLPDLAPADFYLFPWLISALKGRCSCDVIDRIRNATKELKRLSQNGFQECLQHLWRDYTVNGCTVLYFSEIKWFREHFKATTYICVCIYIYILYVCMYIYILNDHLMDFHKRWKNNVNTQIAVCHLPVVSLLLEK
jgi:hypothetical protein